jgi:hypothetical protein
MEPTGSSGESNLSLSTSASMASNRATIANTNIERNAAASDPIKESGELAAQDWPSPPRARRPPRPYVSLLDL